MRPGKTARDRAPREDGQAVSPLARKAEKSALDRELREHMKGKKLSESEKSANPKKRAKMERKLLQRTGKSGRN